MAPARVHLAGHACMGLGNALETQGTAMFNPRLTALIAIILTAALLRLLPHPPNFTPIAAMALFGGAYLADRRVAVAATLAALFISDLFLGLYVEMWAIYVSMALVVLLGGFLSQTRSPLRIAGVALTGSVLFFVLTNFATWALGTMYPLTLAGLVQCYAAAIPFFQNSLAGDAVFTLLLFGGFALAQKAAPALRDRSSPITA